MSDRRAFIQKIASVAIGLQVPWSFEQITQVTQGKIVTVTGAIAPSALGVCLPHEHLMSTFGDEKSESAGYDQDLLLAQVAPYLPATCEKFGLSGDCRLYRRLLRARPCDAPNTLSA